MAGVLKYDLFCVWFLPKFQNNVLCQSSGLLNLVQLFLVAADSGGREFAITGVEGSNIAENMYVCPWCFLCVV